MPQHHSKIDTVKLKQLLDSKRVKCEMCGKKYFALTGHLRAEHGINPSAYQQQFPGVPIYSDLVEKMLFSIDKWAELTLDIVHDKIFAPKADNQTTEGWLAELSKVMPSANQRPELVPAVDKGFTFPEAETKAIVAAIAMGLNAYASGPTGCGKTALIEQIHGRLGRPLFRCNMTGDTSVKNFLGSKEFDPAKGTYFKEGILLQAMRMGATLLVDEVDMMPPHIAAILHPALESGKSVYVADIQQTVNATPGFMVLATANTGGKGEDAGSYTGTEILNTAFLDRFAIKLKMDYPENQTAILTRRFPGEDPTLLDCIARFAVEVQTAFKAGNMSHTLSLRRQQDMINLKNALGLKFAVDSTLYNWLTEEEVTLATQFQNRVGLDKAI